MLNYAAQSYDSEALFPLSVSRNTAHVDSVVLGVKYTACGREKASRDAIFNVRDRKSIIKLFFHYYVFMYHSTLCVYSFILKF